MIYFPSFSSRAIVTAFAGPRDHRRSVLPRRENACSFLAFACASELRSPLVLFQHSPCLFRRCWPVWSLSSSQDQNGYNGPEQKDCGQCGADDGDYVGGGDACGQRQVHSAFGSLPSTAAMCAQAVLSIAVARLARSAVRPWVKAPGHRHWRSPGSCKRSNSWPIYDEPDL